MAIEFTGQVFREKTTYVAYTPELDLSSCAWPQTKTQKNLIEAVRAVFGRCGEESPALSDPARARVCPSQ